LTQTGAFTEIVGSAVADIAGTPPDMTTGGGTSDGRFIKDLCPVVELGVINKTIHKVDEHVSLADITGLTDMYERVLLRFFEAGGLTS